ncbi:hypothetical protein [Methanoregula sp.]|uniref:hypothetical protein n=1 Tax=Methanoregula sp. TaxID=2052170 RepID=UPI003561ACC0
MATNFKCETCSGFVKQTELLMPRCSNAGGCPLSEPKIFRLARHGCPIWSPHPCAE